MNLRNVKYLTIQCPHILNHTHFLTVMYNVTKGGHDWQT